MIFSVNDNRESNDDDWHQRILVLRTCEKRDAEKLEGGYLETRGELNGVDHSF